FRSKFGVWAPQDTNYSEVFNTAIPWIAGVAIGVMAATSEEFLFRLFAIPYLEKLTASRIVAVILPAFFWSFLHSAYPQEPGYIRGIEVGLIGIVAGLVMLRWGILATLVWHYTVDASLVGLLLIRSRSLYFRISGLLVGLAVLIPFGIAVYSRVLRGTFEGDADLLNAAAEPVRTGGAGETVLETEISASGVSAAEPVAVAARGYSALSTGMIGLLCVSMVLGGVATWK